MPCAAITTGKPVAGSQKHLSLGITRAGTVDLGYALVAQGCSLGLQRGLLQGGGCWLGAGIGQIKGCHIPVFGELRRVSQPAGRILRGFAGHRNRPFGHRGDRAT